MDTGLPLHSFRVPSYCLHGVSHVLLMLVWVPSKSVQQFTPMNELLLGANVLYVSMVRCDQLVSHTKFLEYILDPP